MLITRKVEFSSSHICRNPRLSDEENVALYGEGANAAGHGHNFVAEITLDGEPDPVTGMVFDLKDLKAVINKEIVEPYDHRHLNLEVPPFDEIVPTPENLARDIWRRLLPHFPGPAVRLHSVRLYETEDLFVDYFGGDA